MFRVRNYKKNLIRASFFLKKRMRFNVGGTDSSASSDGKAIIFDHIVRYDTVDHELSTIG